jgi:hypothetical protein
VAPVSPKIAQRLGLPAARSATYCGKAALPHRRFTRRLRGAWSGRGHRRAAHRHAMRRLAAPDLQRAQRRGSACNSDHRAHCGVALVAVLSFVIAKAVQTFAGLRVGNDTEEQGSIFAFTANAATTCNEKISGEHGRLSSDCWSGARLDTFSRSKHRHGKRAVQAARGPCCPFGPLVRSEDELLKRARRAGTRGHVVDFELLKLFLPETCRKRASDQGSATRRQGSPMTITQPSFRTKTP